MKKMGMVTAVRFLFSAGTLGYTSSGCCTARTAFVAHEMRPSPKVMMRSACRAMSRFVGPRRIKSDGSVWLESLSSEMISLELALSQVPVELVGPGSARGIDHARPMETRCCLPRRAGWAGWPDRGPQSRVQRSRSAGDSSGCAHPGQRQGDVFPRR